MNEGLSPSTRAIEDALKTIPRGRVTTYGQVGLMAGFPKGARQVARVLHARSRAAGLPWWRVLARGPRPGTARIALGDSGFGEQAALLSSEGVVVSPAGIVDLGEYGYPGGG